MFSFSAPPDPRRFPIVAWGQSPHDAAQLLKMKDAGFNVSGFCRVEDLPAILAAGLTCFVSDPRANGYDWTQMPPRGVLEKNAADLRRAVNGNHAALGFFLYDEPAARMLDGLAAMEAVLRSQMPELWPYVNAFPSGAPSTTQPLGYQEYLSAQARRLGQPFLSFDHYALLGGEIRDSFFSNLEIARAVSLETNTPFWTCILSNAHFNYMEPTEATLGAQIFSVLAYGGRGIEYFTYFAPDDANYRLAPIDQFGNATPTWDLVKRLNQELAVLAPFILQLHSTGVYHFPSPPDGGRNLSASSLVSTVAFPGLEAGSHLPRLLFGEFRDNDNHPWLIAVNRELDRSVRIRIVLRDVKRSMTVVSPFSGTLKPLSDGTYWLAPGGGVLLKIL